MILKYIKYKLYSWTIAPIKDAIPYFTRDKYMDTVFKAPTNVEYDYEKKERILYPGLVIIISWVLVFPTLFVWMIYILVHLVVSYIKEDYNQFKESQK